MRLIMIAAVFFGLGSMLQAQVTTGTISGKVVDATTNESVPGAKVWTYTDGSFRGVICDVNGMYKLDGLKPGTYTVYSKSTGYDTTVFLGVLAAPEAITFLDVKLTSNNLLTAVPIIWEAPVMDKNLPRIRITTEYIEQSPNIRNPLALLSNFSSEIQMPEGSSQVIIRGSRPGDAVYYIDGVKMTDMGTVPGAAIGSVEAYTGGVPAKYGDTTGGVVVLETKSYFDLYNAWLAGQ
ncbi:MAG: carboxypeptidase regulatory-like domain-containing protein [Bacteroidetes bacterium]|nr:carboxypeptidase regulatory-like domain-containing protein [Bacteroidota bacterium]